MLCNRSFTSEENRRVYGKCSNPGGHGHNYGLEVTVTGPIDERTGELMSRERLDAVVESRVLQRFGHRMLNDDEIFRDRVPTAENIAEGIFEQLEGPIAQAGSARLRRVRVLETRKNAFIYGEM